MCVVVLCCVVGWWHGGVGCVGCWCLFVLCVGVVFDFVGFWFLLCCVVFGLIWFVVVGVVWCVVVGLFVLLRAVCCVLVELCCCSLFCIDFALMCECSVFRCDVI